MWPHKWHCLFYTFFYHIICGTSSGVNIHRNWLGVSFSPCVNRSMETKYPNYEYYQFEDIQVMMQIISRKFSKFLLNSDFAFEGLNEYVDNRTYYENSYVSVRTGEAAALLNIKTGYKILSLSIIVNIQSDSVKRNDIELNLAFEAADKANEIFPYTVEGIILWESEKNSEMKQSLEYLKNLKKNASRLEVKLGAKVDCDELAYQKNVVSETKTIRPLVAHSDILLCLVDEPDKDTNPFDHLNKLGNDLLRYRTIIKGINKNADVIGYTGWSSAGIGQFETVNDFGIYWQEVSYWAFVRNYQIYMQEAFDNPFREGREAHLGWWKLTDYRKFKMLEGYEEKVSEEIKEIDIYKSAAKQPVNWMQFEIFITIAILFIFL